jgi:hypothetical protein
MACRSDFCWYFGDLHHLSEALLGRVQPDDPRGAFSLVDLTPVLPDVQFVAVAKREEEDERAWLRPRDRATVRDPGPRLKPEEAKARLLKNRPCLKPQP